MNDKIFVLGKTNTREVYIITQGKPFIQSEYVIIEDALHKNLIGEIIETNVIPMIVSSLLPTGCVPEYIEALGFDLKQITAIGKVKILDDIQYPVTPNSVVRKPQYDEIKHLLINANLPDGMLLGIIRGTEDIYVSLPNDLKNIVPLWVDKKIVPQNGVPFTLNHRKLREYPGVGLFGGAGSGKTVALRSYCEELMELGIPGLAFDIHFELDFKEPNEGIDSSQIRDYSDKYEIFEIGKNLGIKFTDLNVGELINLLEFSSELTPPMRSALEAIYEKGDVYEHLMNKIHKLRAVFDNEAKQKREREDMAEDAILLYMKHKNEISGSGTLQALSWRLTGLYGSGIFTGNTELVEKAIKNCKLAVLRSKREMSLKMISAYLINKLYKKRRDYQDYDQQLDNNFDKPDYFPMFFIIIDEAHNFAPDNKVDTPNKRTLRVIAQEARKYGVFNVLATQRPSLLDTTILAQLNTKFIFRTNLKADMDTVKVETNLTDDEFTRLPDLASGNCFVSSATLRKTYFVKFRTTRTKSPHQKDPFDQLAEYREKIEGNSLDNVVKEMLPIKNEKIPSIHAEINRCFGTGVTVEEIREALDRLVKKGEAVEEKTPMGKIYKSYVLK